MGQQFGGPSPQEGRHQAGAAGREPGRGARGNGRDSHTTHSPAAKVAHRTCAYDTSRAAPRGNRVGQGARHGSMVARSTYIPERGDMVWIDFNPQKGHE